MLGTQREAGGLPRWKGWFPGLPEPGAGCTGVSLTDPPGRMPLSAEPAKVTSALINLINKTVHQGGHYLLMGDDRAGRLRPGGRSDSLTSCGPSRPERSPGGWQGSRGGGVAELLPASRTRLVPGGGSSQRPYTAPLSTARGAHPGRPLPASPLPLTPASLR